MELVRNQSDQIAQLYDDYGDMVFRLAYSILLNQADKETIMALPGIGEVLAERIVAYRQENGAFSSPEELLNVEGIGKKRLEEILDFISIGG